MPYVLDPVVLTKGTGMGDSYEIPLCHFPKHCPQGEPIIVPPSFLKPEMREPLTLVWQGAAAALNKAERVVFVGYSFPPSDIEMKFFFASCFTSNPRLEEIIIIDPYANDIAGRLKSNSSGFGNHFTSLLKPLPVESWENAVPNAQAFFQSRLANARLRSLG